MHQAHGRIIHRIIETAISATACCAALLAAAPAAPASNVGVGPSQQLLVEEGASPQANVISVTQSGGTTVVTDAAGVQPAAGSGCVANTPNQVTCTGSYPVVQVLAGALNDWVTLALDVPASAVGLAPMRLPGFIATNAVRGDDGDDVIDASRTVNASQLPLTLIGGEGSNVVTGSSGSDKIDVAEGTNTVHAGAGDDDIRGYHYFEGVLSGGSGAPREDRPSDVIACGEGIDDTSAGRGDSLKIDCEKLGLRPVHSGKVRCGCTMKLTARGKKLGFRRLKGRQENFTPELSLNAAKAAAVIGAAASVPAKFKVRISERGDDGFVKNSRSFRFFLTK